MKTILILKFFIFFSCALLVTACGFHLRSAPQFSSLYGSIAVVTPDQLKNTVLVRTLNRRLIQSGVQVVDEVEKSDAVIILSNYQLHRRDVASGLSGQEREYTMQMIVDIELKDNLQNSIFENTTFSSQRDLRYDESKVLGKSEGETLVEQDMSNVILASFIRRLDAQLNLGAE